MSDTPQTQPQTPAEVAGEIADAINAAREHTTTYILNQLKEINHGS